MASLFSRFFNPEKGQPVSNKVDSETTVRVATSAILMEIAAADNEFTDEEKVHVVETLRREFSLSDEEAAELMALARKRLDESIDFWSIANAANRGLAESEKLRIMEAAWKIIYSDGELSGHEDVFVHKLYYLLGLTHDQMIEIKLRVHSQMRRDKE